MLISNLRVERLSAERKEDFYKVHDADSFGDWCYCAAWWVPTWEGWNDRTHEQNRALRESLFDAGIYDGYLLYMDDEPRGWCQAGPRDQLSKLLSVYTLPEDDSVWAITCFSIHPTLTGKGIAHTFLDLVLTDLRARGAKRVQAFPHVGIDLPVDEIWTGPLAIYQKAGFKFIKTDEKRPVLELEL